MRMVSRWARAAWLSLLWAAAPALAGPFLVEPYLQLGAAPGPGTLELLWHGPDRDDPWAVEVRRGLRGPWRPVPRPAWTRVAVSGVEPHRVFAARLAPLAPGADFAYRVLLAGTPVFLSRARAPKGPGQPLRVAVLGDLAAGGPAPRELAFQVYRQHPDLVVLPGDLVYQDGRITEYRKHFYPVYNADRSGPALGAPLLRSTLTVGALGNHDVGERGPLHPQAAEPDGLAYYLYWDQPLNGPPLAPDGPHAPPLRPGPDWTWDAFRTAAGARFPTMGSFSFDAGGVHWTVLDSNRYMDWTDPALAAWLDQDLARARSAAWRFVVFHHPAFDLAEDNRYLDSWMARIWPVLERRRVDLVFTGHIHTYARTRPLRFTPDPAAPGAPPGPVPGRVAWDARFDGRARTRARGVIHLITGGGGAHLHLKGRPEPVAKPYVVRIVSQEHSYSLLDVRGRRVRFRQLGVDGRELDRFVLAR
jgi:hypothetical protein